MSLFEIILTNSQVDNLVDPLELKEIVKQVFKGDVDAPLRASVEKHGSWYAAMVAGGSGFFSTKLVGVYPENPQKGLPLVRAHIVLFDAKTGKPLLLSEAEAATGWRTAAGSIVALEVFGLKSIDTLGIIGAGFQGRYHARSITRLYSPSRILVYDQFKSRAEEFTKLFSNASIVELEYLLKNSDVIVSATTSTEPVIKGELLKENTIILSIGAPRPVKELDETVKRRAGCLLADTKEGVLSESEDAVGFKKVVDLRSVLRGEESCDYDEIKIYKSVGTALFDHSIAIYLYKKSLGKE